MVNTLAVDNDAKQTIDALQSELQKTKEKLQAVEELKKQSGIKNCLNFSYVLMLVVTDISVAQLVTWSNVLLDEFYGILIIFLLFFIFLIG